MPGAQAGDGCVTIVAAPEPSLISWPQVAAERDAAKRTLDLLEHAAQRFGLDALDPDFAGFY